MRISVVVQQPIFILKKQSSAVHKRNISVTYLTKPLPLCKKKLIPTRYFVILISFIRANDIDILPLLTFCM